MALLGQPAVKGFNFDPRLQIEFRGPKLHEEEAIASGADYQGSSRIPKQHHFLCAFPPAAGDWRGLGRPRGVEKAPGLLQGDRLKTELIPGAELPQLPAVGLGHRRGANKAPQTGPIGAKDNGHIAGEVDGAEGVSVIVDVRGVKPCVAAVFPHPLGFGSK